MCMWEGVGFICVLRYLLVCVCVCVCVCGRVIHYTSSKTNDITPGEKQRRQGQLKMKSY